MNRTGFWMLIASLALAAGCSKHEESASAGTTSDESASEESSSEGDPCSLLEVKDVEAAIGPLAGPPFRLGMDGPEKNGGKCKYEARDLHSLTIDVTWSEGESIMRMLGMPAAAADQAGLRGKLPLPDGVMLSGDWDEAKSLSCCEITALLGEQVVAIDFLATSLTTEQGVALLNLALKRLSAPLTNIDGNAGVAAANQRVQTAAGRPAAVPACELFTAADAAALLGEAVDKLPEAQNNQCEYRGKPAIRIVSFRVEWSGGYRKWRSDRDVAGKIMGTMMGDLAKPQSANDSAAPPSVSSGPWETGEMVAMDFVAVKRDVMFSVNMTGTTLVNAQKIATTAMNKIAWAAP